jgi:hypothetical protein
MSEIDPTIQKAIVSLATEIVNATELKGDAHFHAALQIERALKAFAETILTAASKRSDV